MTDTPQKLPGIATRIDHCARFPPFSRTFELQWSGRGPKILRANNNTLSPPPRTELPSAAYARAITDRHTPQTTVTLLRLRRG